MLDVDRSGKKQIPFPSLFFDQIRDKSFPQIQVFWIDGPFSFKCDPENIWRVYSFDFFR